MPIVSPKGKRFSFGELVMRLMKQRHLSRDKAEGLAGYLEHKAPGWSSPRRSKHRGSGKGQDN
jgi:hypothetical protein